MRSFTKCSPRNVELLAINISDCKYTPSWSPQSSCVHINRQTAVVVPVSKPLHLHSVWWFIAVTNETNHMSSVDFIMLFKAGLCSTVMSQQGQQKVVWVPTGGCQCSSQGCRREVVAHANCLRYLGQEVQDPVAPGGGVLKRISLNFPIYFWGMMVLNAELKLRSGILT